MKQPRYLWAGAALVAAVLLGWFFMHAAGDTLQADSTGAAATTAPTLMPVVQGWQKAWDARDEQAWLELFAPQAQDDALAMWRTYAYTTALQAEPGWWGRWNITAQVSQGDSDRLFPLDVAVWYDDDTGLITAIQVQ